MKREIKFRGKDLENENGWRYGSLIVYPDGNRVIVEFDKDENELSYDVSSDTVGQFTGIRDAQGKEIYEGDIVLQQGYNGRKQPMKVRFECGAFIVGYHGGSSTKQTPMLLNSRSEVVGNVFDDKLEDYK